MRKLLELVATLGTGDEYWICFNGDRTNGGLMKTRQAGVPSFWYPYFAVASADAVAQFVHRVGHP